MVPRARSVSDAKRAGLVFPTAVVGRAARALGVRRLGRDAKVALAACLQHHVENALLQGEKSMTSQPDSRRRRKKVHRRGIMKPEHLLVGMQTEEDASSSVIRSFLDGAMVHKVIPLAARSHSTRAEDAHREAEKERALRKKLTKKMNKKKKVKVKVKAGMKKKPAVKKKKS